MLLGHTVNNPFIIHDGVKLNIENTEPIRYYDTQRLLLPVGIAKGAKHRYISLVLGFTTGGGETLYLVLGRAASSVLDRSAGRVNFRLVLRRAASSALG